MTEILQICSNFSKKDMHYNFCPICGGRLVDRQAGDDGAVPFCENCDKFWFDSFASCVIVMVVNEFHEIAMLQQSYLSTEHKTFVAGFMVPGETAEQTAIREVKEELGLDVERLEYAGTHWFADREQLMHAFIGHVKKQSFTLSQEVDGAAWVPVAEAEQQMFPKRPGNTQHYILRRYMEELAQINE